MSISNKADDARRPHRLLTTGLSLMIVIILLLGGAAFATQREFTSAVAKAEAARSLQIEIERLRFLSERRGSAYRAYLLTGDASFREEGERERKAFRDLLARIRVGTTREETRLLAVIADRDGSYESAMSGLIARRPEYRDTPAGIARDFLRDVRPRRLALNAALTELGDHERSQAESARASARQNGNRTRGLMVVLTLTAAGLGIALAIVLGRTLTHMFAIERESRRAAEALVEETRAQRAQLEEILSADRGTR